MNTLSHMSEPTRVRPPEIAVMRRDYPDISGLSDYVSYRARGSLLADGDTRCRVLVRLARRPRAPAGQGFETSERAPIGATLFGRRDGAEASSTTSTTTPCRDCATP